MKVLYLGISAIVSVLSAAHASCDCDAAGARRLYVNTEKSTVVFSEAIVKGEHFLRHSKKARAFQPVSTTASETCPSQQVHITLGNQLNSIIISFASSDFATASIVEYSTDFRDLSAENKANIALGKRRAYSELLYTVPNLETPSMGEPTAAAQQVIDMQDTKEWAYDHKTGEKYSNWYNVTALKYGFGQYNNPDFYYHSPLLHTVEITGLLSGETYFYRVADSCNIFNFTMPLFQFSSATNAPSSYYPFQMGLTGDLGLTDVSIKSMNALQALDPDVVLLVGDLSYADGWQYSWDTFGNAIQFLASTVPLLSTTGNHETGFGENDLPYNYRYPTPFVGSGSPDPSYWGREVGPVHIVAINSYAGFAADSLQYAWLDTYLSTFLNRQRTPWLIIIMHTPFYNTNTGHWMEGEKFRVGMEPLFYKYGVDVVVSGHVHSYERTAAVYNNSLDICGTVHLGLGDGGNYEGYAGAWRDATSVPWSLFREASFGVAGLTVVNESHAFFSWHRHACQSADPEAYFMNFSSSCSTYGDNSAQAMETSDQTWIVRPSQSTCSNHYVSSNYAPSDTSISTGDNSDSDLSSENIVLIVLCCLLALLNVALYAMYAAVKNQQGPRGYSSLSVGGIPADAHFREYRGGNSKPLSTADTTTAVRGGKGADSVSLSALDERSDILR
jgi:hypothetical protein